MATETTATASAAAVVGGAGLAGYGIDLTTIGAAFLGVIVVQTLMPASEIKLRALVTITLGSMVFSSLGTPLLLLWALENIEIMRKLREWHAHALVAAVAGGFAQPILIGVAAAVRAVAAKWLPAPPGAVVPAAPDKGDPP